MHGEAKERAKPKKRPGTTDTHLHTRTLVRRKHLQRNLPCARCHPVKLDVDFGLREVVGTTYPRQIECITQMDRRREDAVVDFCSTTVQCSSDQANPPHELQDSFWQSM